MVKKIFSDTGEEALAFLHAKEDSTLESLHQSLFKQISSCRKAGEVDASTDAMNILNKMPRFLSKFLVWLLTPSGHPRLDPPEHHRHRPLL